MPISPPPSIAGQITPSGVQPYSNQSNFGQVIGRVIGYHSACTPTVGQNLINNVVRRAYDRRLWYGLMTKGQIVTPGYYSQGTITATFGSKSVQGIGTAWNGAMIGQQLRQGFTAPIYTIVNVDILNQVLTLELPWGLPTVTSIGYFITQYYYSFPNIKYFYSVKNLQLMYRMWTNVPQSLIENWDPSRLQMVFPRVVATMPPDSNGNYQVELWPSPNTQQALPYLAYVQPPNLVKDEDNFPPFMRADTFELGAIAEVLRYKPKTNEYYSEAAAITVADTFSKNFEYELVKAESADENLFRQDIVTSAEQFPLVQMDGMGNYIGGGGYMAAMSPVMAGDY
jgi:hypothetical protein